MRLKLLACAVACVFLFAVNAVADTYNYTFTLTNGTNTFTWSLPDDPPGLSINPLGLTVGFFVPGVTISENGTAITATLKFFGSYFSGGGIAICAPDCSTSVLAIGFGSTLFSGSTSPDFTHGTFSLNDGTYGPSTVIISGFTAITPEPASVLLLLTGAVCLAGFRRRI